MLAGGQTLCSFSGIMKLAVHIIDICMHVDKFSHFTVTVSVENVSGSIPAARVTCSRALPPDCVTSVVEFRTKSGTLVATNTSSNTVVTKIIRLVRATGYVIAVVVTGNAINSCDQSVASTLRSEQVQVVVEVKNLCS